MLGVNVFELMVYREAKHAHSFADTISQTQRNIDNECYWAIGCLVSSRHMLGQRARRWMPVLARPWRTFVDMRSQEMEGKRGHVNG